MSTENLTIEEATDFFSALFRGHHHIPRKGIVPVRHSGGAGWCVNTCEDLSTFDSDMLTRLVFMAHDCCYRASVLHSGPGLVKIAIWKRQREGGLCDRHPILESAVKDWRLKNSD